MIRRAIRQQPARGGRRQYANGAVFERKVKVDLERRGFFVIRSAGSKSPVDLVAVAADATLLVQCKRSGACSAEERETLLTVAQLTGRTALLALGVRTGFRYCLAHNEQDWNDFAR